MWPWIRIQIGPKSWIRNQIQCIWIHNTDDVNDSFLAHANTVVTFLCKFTTLLAALPVRYGEAARPLQLGQHNDHLPAHVHIAQVVTKSATRNRDEDPDPHFLI